MAVNSAFAYSHTVRRVSISVIRTLPKRMNVTLINAVISRAAALDFLFYDFLSNVCPTFFKKCFYPLFRAEYLFTIIYIMHVLPLDIFQHIPVCQPKYFAF